MTTQDNGGGTVDVTTLTAEQIADIEKAEDFILGFKDEDYNDPDKLEELKEAQKKAVTTIHQKRHFRSKASELEGELKIFKEPGKKPEVKPKEGEPAADDKKGVDPNQIVNFRLDYPSYSKEVISEITRLAGAFGISMEEAAASETGKAVIKTIQSKDDNADASIAPSRKAGTGLDKKDWSNASQAEIEAERNKILTGQ